MASRAVAMARAHLPSDDWRLAYFLDTLAEIAAPDGLLAEAEPLYRRVARLCAKLPSDPRVRAEIEAHSAALLRRTRRLMPVGSTSTPSPRR